MGLFQWIFSLFHPSAPGKPLPAGADTPGEPVEIHLVLKFPPPGVAPDPDNILVTAKVERTVNKDGKRDYKLQSSPQADALTVMEANSAIHWREAIDYGGLKNEKVIGWLLSVGRLTSFDYIRPDIETCKASDLEVEVTTGITLLSLHYGIANIEKLGYPENILRWFRKMCKDGPSYDRVDAIMRAGRLESALQSGGLDPELVSHLYRAVGGVEKSG